MPVLPRINPVEQVYLFYHDFVAQGLSTSLLVKPDIALAGACINKNRRGFIDPIQESFYVEIRSSPLLAIHAGDGLSFLSLFVRINALIVKAVKGFISLE